LSKYIDQKNLLVDVDGVNADSGGFDGHDHSNGPTTPKPTAGTMAPTSLPAHLDPKSAISTDRSVYFDFDDYSIKKEYGPLIERHGRYLASNPRLALA